MSADVKSAGILNDQTLALHNIIRIQFTWPILLHQALTEDPASVTFRLIGWTLSTAVGKSSSFPLSLQALWYLPLLSRSRQNDQTHNKYLLIGLDSIVMWGRLLTFSYKMKSWFIFQMNYRLLWNALCSNKDHFILLKSFSPCFVCLCAADKTKLSFSVFFMSVICTGYWLWIHGGFYCSLKSS